MENEQINILAELIKAKEALDNAVDFIMNPPSEKKSFPDLIKLIQSSCISYYEITVSEFKSGSRKREHVFARFIFFRLCKDIKGKSISLSTLGGYVDKDHASVLHGFKEIEKARQTNDILWSDYLNIKDSVTKALNEFVFDNMEVNNTKEKNNNHENKR